MDQKGQILIPSLLIFPCIFLFVFLIYETGKLSTAKIRHQFAVDSAAFVEMTNYSDFLNRTAYVNGPFPMRVFKEGFGPGIDPNTGKPTSGTPVLSTSGTKDTTFYELLYANSLFPRAEPDPTDSDPVWPIRYGGPEADTLNRNPPDVSPQCQNQPSSGGSCRDIVTDQNANDYYLSWEAVNDLYKLYYKVYSLLGSVEDAQFSVFCRLTGASGCPGGGAEHNLFKKSYYFNTNDSINDASEGALGFSHPFRPKPYCLQQIMFYGRKPTGNYFQATQITSPQSPIQMPGTIAGCSPAGLFQVEAVPDSDLRALRSRNAGAGSCAAGSPWVGYPIIQHWRAPDNFFNVDFNSLMEDRNPCVHATVALQGGRVWPDPTPKFQTKLYP